MDYVINIIKHGSQCCMDYTGRPAIHLVCPEFERRSPKDEGLYNYNPHVAYDCHA